MKSFAVAIAATAIGAVFAVETCDYSAVKPDFHQLGTPMADCVTATGLNFTTGSALSLSSEEQSEICSECSEMVEVVYSFDWLDCEIEIDGVNQTLSTYFETLVGTCSNSTSSGSTSSSTGSVASTVETCDYSAIKPDFHQLGTPMADCVTATGINFTTGSALSLTSEQQSDICTECSEMVELVYSFDWLDCEIEIDGVNQTLSTYFETLVGTCANTTGSSSTTAAAGSTSNTSSSSSSDAGTLVTSALVAALAAVAALAL